MFPVCGQHKNNKQDDYKTSRSRSREKERKRKEKAKEIDRYTKIINKQGENRQFKCKQATQTNRAQQIYNQ
jgi:hypothetical protein